MRKETEKEESEGGAPYVAYGFESVRTPYDTRHTDRRTDKTPYDEVRQSKTP